MRITLLVIDVFHNLTINGFSLLLLFSIFLFVIVFKKFLSSYFVNYITCTGLSFVLFLHVNVFRLVCFNGNVYQSIPIKWIDGFNYFNVVSWQFFFDPISTIMSVLVVFISLLVHIYSIGYMKYDPNNKKFMAFLTLFTFFMLVLVVSKNLIQLFIGWEGVGLVSYLLINFWQTRINANKSALKAIVVNKVGDIAVFIAIGFLLCSFKTTDFVVISSIIEYTVPLFTIQVFSIFFSSFDVIALMLFIGAVGKSAQFGLHTWLPDAMEGPTPVSALIHAATMVTAGVFLVIRCSFIFDRSVYVLFIMSLLGALTALLAATTALFQNDLKKIIAYSTCSQLGYMITICGSSLYNLSFFHLVNHAFFKALLFLGAGVIIHNLNDEQDIRRMGGLGQIYPFVYVVMFIASCSLMGLPFLTGFYSKELIILAKWSTSITVIELFMSYILVFSAILTAMYSFRLLHLVFFGEFNGYRGVANNYHTPNLFLYSPLMILVMFSIFAGYCLNEIFIGFGTNVFQQFPVMNTPIGIIADVEFSKLYFKLSPLILSLLGAISYCFFLIWFRSNWPITTLSNIVDFYKFFNNKWHFDIIYERIVTRNFFYISKYLTINIERGLLELLFVTISKKFLNEKFKYVFIKYIAANGNLVSYMYYLSVGFILFAVGFKISSFFISIDLCIVLCGIFIIYIYNEIRND